MKKIKKGDIIKFLPNARITADGIIDSDFSYEKEGFLTETLGIYLKKNSKRSKTDVKQLHDIYVSKFGTIYFFYEEEFEILENK
jgi:hypothetical protein